MTPSDLRERVASLRDSVANAIIKDFSNCSFACDPGECTYRNITPGECACRESASVIIDLVLEEAAKVAKAYEHPNMALYNHQTGIAAEILALKSRNDPQTS